MMRFAQVLCQTQSYPFWACGAFSSTERLDPIVETRPLSQHRSRGPKFNSTQFQCSKQYGSDREKVDEMQNFLTLYDTVWWLREYVFLPPDSVLQSQVLILHSRLVPRCKWRSIWFQSLFDVRVKLLKQEMREQQHGENTNILFYSIFCKLWSLFE